MFLGSLRGALRERRVGDQDGHRFGLWILLPCDLKEAFSQGQVWARPSRNHHEILRVVELRVDSERHEAEKESLAFHDQRHRWRDGIVSVAADHDIDLLNIEETLVNVGYKFGVRLIVEANELHRPAEEFAVCIDVLLPDLVGESGGLAVRCERARERQTISDSEWRSVHGPGLEGDEGEQSADDRDVLDHVHDLIRAGRGIAGQWSVDRDRRKDEEHDQRDRNIASPHIEEQAKAARSLDSDERGHKKRRDWKTDGGQDCRRRSKGKDLSSARRDKEERD